MQEENHPLARHIERFMEQVKVLSWSPKSIASYRTHLGMFLRFIKSETAVEEVSEVTAGILYKYQTYLYGWANQKGRSSSIATQAARLSAVRSFFRHLVRTGVLPFDPSSTLILPKRKYTLPRAILTKREVVRLLKAPDASTALGLRDRAMIEVLYSTGIRNAELRALKLYDLDFQRGLVRINAGKNSKDRVVPLGQAARTCLRQYLDEARPELLLERSDQAAAEETAFLSKTGRPLEGLGLICAIREHGKRARLKRPITPHTLRHTFATHMLAGRADIRHIQVMMGHASIASTQIYTQVEITDLKAVHRRCHPREQR